MKFKYFEQPEKFAHFIEEKTHCSICEESKRCFDATAFYGEESIHAICSDCLANGKLKSYAITTCEGDTEELSRQLKTLSPALASNEIADIVREKTEELEKTTPQLISWQDWNWPCADGDYCSFIGYGSKALYNRLDKNNDGAWTFQLSLYYTVKDEEDADELWDEYMPAKAIKSYEESTEYDTLFYVFKSLISNQIVTIWDAS
ncbi:CbrC family protein [Runella sp.]|uniref:CbrC family protein n=1 Tax=Runella sp. TaxID=1960881 RepID=UPI003D13A90A